MAPELFLGREEEEEVAALKAAGYCAGADVAGGAGDVAGAEMAFSCIWRAAICYWRLSMSMGTGPELLLVVLVEGYAEGYYSPI